MRTTRKNRKSLMRTMRELKTTDLVIVLPEWIKDANEEIAELESIQKDVMERIEVIKRSVEVIENFSDFINRDFKI